MNGTVKKKTDRGYGFISRDDSDKDLFFHSNDLQGISFDELQEGTAVTFEVENGQKGPAAKNVQVANAGQSSDDSDDSNSTEVAVEPEDDQDDDDADDADEEVEEEN